MDTSEVTKRLKDEIIQGTDDELLTNFDGSALSNVANKIAHTLGETKFGKNFYIDRFSVTEGENKNNERIFYIKGSFFHHNNSESVYYAFNSEGEYVGCVKAFVCNLVPPTQVEIEYWADENHMNQGNMTTLARDVIKDIFVNRSYDGFTIREGLPKSNIDSIAVAIGEENYPSLAVAKKLGFDEKGVLRMTDYYNQIETPKKM